MATFVNDTFTDTATTTLASHTGETGATWTKVTGFTDSAEISNANAVRSSSPTTVVVYYASGSPGSADYYVEADINFLTDAPYVVLLARLSTSALTGYQLSYEGAGVWKLYRVTAGTQTLLDTYSSAVSGVKTYRISVSGTGATVTITCTLDGAAQTPYADTSGSRITTAGKAGLQFYDTSGGGNSAGPHVTAFRAADLSSSATSYTFTGPSSGVVNVASTNFTVTPNGDATGIEVTPASDGSGSFTPSSVTFTGSGAETFTYTPTSTTGSPHTLSVTDDGGLTDPASIDYTVNAAPVTVAVNDANWFYVAEGWYRNGSTYLQSTNPGNYFKLGVTGTTSVKLNVSVSPLTGASVSSGDYPTIYYRVGSTGDFTRYQLTSSDTQLTLATGLTTGTTYDVEVHFVGCDWDSYDRWTTPSMALRITGIELTSAGSTAAHSTILSGRALFYGDSDSEGWEALASTVSVANQDAWLAFPRLIARARGCEYAVVGFAGQGWTTGPGGSSNVPDFEDAWDFYHSGQTRLSGGLFPSNPEVWIHHGRNDSSGVQTAVEATIPAIRAAMGATRPMFVCQPSNRNQQAAITAGEAAAGSAYSHILDTGLDLLTPFDNGTHLSGLRGHPNYAAEMLRLADAADGSGSGSAGGTLINRGLVS